MITEPQFILTERGWWVYWPGHDGNERYAGPYRWKWQARLKSLMEVGRRPMTMFRVRYMEQPGLPHVYCRVFAAYDGGTYAGLGNLTMRRNEFEQFRTKFNAEFVKDEMDAEV